MIEKYIGDISREDLLRDVAPKLLKSWKGPLHEYLVDVLKTDFAVDKLMVISLYDTDFEHYVSEVALRMKGSGGKKYNMGLIDAMRAVEQFKRNELNRSSYGKELNWIKNGPSAEQGKQLVAERKAVYDSTGNLVIHPLLVEIATSYSNRKLD